MSELTFIFVRCSFSKLPQRRLEINKIKSEFLDAQISDLRIVSIWSLDSTPRIPLRSSGIFDTSHAESLTVSKMLSLNKENVNHKVSDTNLRDLIIPFCKIQEGISNVDFQNICH